MPVSAPLTTLVQCCLTGLLLASSARADNFGVVKVDARSMIMINLDKITDTPEGHRRAWIATAWSGYAPSNIYSSRDYVEYDCSGRRYRIISTITYGRNNSKLRTIDYAEEWRRAGPKANAYIGSNIVCNTLGVGGGLLSGEEFALINTYRRVARK